MVIKTDLVQFKNSHLDLIQCDLIRFNSILEDLGQIMSNYSNV